MFSGLKKQKVDDEVVDIELDPTHTEHETHISTIEVKESNKDGDEAALLPSVNIEQPTEQGDTLFSKEYTFQCTIKNIQIRDNRADIPYLVFTIGGDYKVEDLRHKGLGIVKSGKKGKIFKTEVLKTPQDISAGNLSVFSQK
jgi:hypothetical protein